MFYSGNDLLKMCHEKNASIGAIAIDDEMNSSGLTRESIINKMKYNLNIMIESASAALECDIKSVSGLIGGDAKRINTRNRSKNTICGYYVNKAIARALSCSEVNAAMGKIVAAPTAGSCGILPAVVITVSEIYDSSEDDIINALFTAAAIGGIIGHNATLSGAEGGCQAECGSAAAMAAASAVELSGGTPQMCLDAAAIAIKCVLGLICDPVAGLVEVPCSKRNAMGATNAMVAADMALSGVESVIPFDEVVDAMYKIGNAMPCQFKETATGGLAVTKKGLILKNKIFG